MFRFAPLALLAAACGLRTNIRAGAEFPVNTVIAPAIASQPVRRARLSFPNGYRRRGREWQREKPDGKAAQRRLRQRARLSTPD